MATTNNNRLSLNNLILKEINGARKGCLSNTTLSNVLRCIVNELGDEIDNINGKLTMNDALISVVQSNLIQEIADRTSGDANLQNQIDNLSNGNTDIIAQITQEIANRMAADTALQNNIDINSACITDIKSDITDLQAEDADLQTQINSNDNELTSQQAQIVSNDIDIAALQNQVNQLGRYNLSNTEVQLDYTYFGDIVYGILLQIPAPVSGTNYIFAHNLNIDKYLTLEVVNDGIPKVPSSFVSNAGREDFLQLVNRELGSLALGSSSINVDGVDFSGFNSFIYIEYTKSLASEGIGLDIIGTSAIGVG